MSYTPPDFMDSFKPKKGSFADGAPDYSLPDPSKGYSLPNPSEGFAPPKSDCSTNFKLLVPPECEEITHTIPLTRTTTNTKYHTQKPLKLQQKDSYQKTIKDFIP